MPVTKPVADPIVAMNVAEELQLPPILPSYSNEVCPAQIFVIPYIGPGIASTVTVAKTEQPAP
jgi:hypothetical protein